MKNYIKRTVGPGGEDKKIMFMCPNCFRMHGVNDVSLTVEIGDEQDVHITPDMRTLLESAFVVYCEKCGVEMVPIDYDIAPDVRRFNEKGYHTLHCCSGHMNVIDENRSICEYPTAVIDEQDVYITFGVNPFHVFMEPETSIKCKAKILDYRDLVFKNLTDAFDRCKKRANDRFQFNQRNEPLFPVTTFMMKLQRELDACEYTTIQISDTVEDDPRVEFRLNFMKAREDGLDNYDMYKLIIGFRDVINEVAGDVPKIDPLDLSEFNVKSKWLVPYVTHLRNQEYED